MGVGKRDGHIPCPTGNDFVRNGNPIHFFKGGDHIQHAVSHAGAQVENLGARMFHSVFHRRHVTTGQVYYVDVIPNPRAVGGGIIVTKHLQAGQFADCHLRNIGHQVVGDAVGVLPDGAAFVGADGVEIPQ